MEYLSQFLIILGFSLAGECLQRWIPLPIPASVYGLVLLFAALCLKIVKLDQIRRAGSFLISILPILFVSPVVGILENWGLIRGALVPVFLGSLSNVGVEKNQNNFQRVSGISRHSFSDQSKRVFFCEISGSFLHRNRCV